jgi:nicotinamide-nucleotide amidase
MFVDDPLLTEDARGLVADLTVRRQSVATAESLTAGLLAATLGSHISCASKAVAREPMATQRAFT